MIRVIGLGSPFGDDTAGWRVIEQLRGRLAPEVDLLALDRPGVALVSWMAGVDTLCLVDAVDDGGPPGRLLQLTPADVRGLEAGLSSHQLALHDTLQLAATLGSLPSRIEIHGIAINGRLQNDHRVNQAIAQLSDQLAADLAMNGQTGSQYSPPAVP